MRRSEVLGDASERIACRVWLYVESMKDSAIKTYTKTSVLAILVGEKTAKSYINNGRLPKWWTDLEEKIPQYDNDWNDWTLKERIFIAKRLAEGFDIDLLQEVLSIPEKIMTEAITKAQATMINPDVVSRVTAITDGDMFTENDISDPVIRTLANERWMQYKSRINMDNPVNDATVRSIVLMETELMKMERIVQEAAPGSDEHGKAITAYKDLRKLFSEAAEDIAQLERQQEIRVDGEGLDDIFEHAVEVLSTWRDNSIPRRAEESGLVDMMVKLHRVDMNDIPQPKPEREGDPTQVKQKPDLQDLPLRIDERKQGGNTGVAIIG